jgi:hypothetical protein
MAYRVGQGAGSGNSTWPLAIGICLIGLSALIYDAYEYRGFYAGAHPVTGTVVGDDVHGTRMHSHTIYIYLPPREAFREVHVESLHSLDYHSQVVVLVNPHHPKQAVLPGMRMDTQLGLWFFPIAFAYWVGGFVRRR